MQVRDEWPTGQIRPASDAWTLNHDNLPSPLRTATHEFGSTRLGLEDSYEDRPQCPDRTGLTDGPYPLEESCVFDFCVAGLLLHGRPVQTLDRTSLSSLPKGSTPFVTGSRASSRILARTGKRWAGAIEICRGVKRRSRLRPHVARLRVLSSDA